MTLCNTKSVYPWEPYPLAETYPYSNANEIYYKIHKPRDLQSLELGTFNPSSSLILLLRDPYECIASDTRHNHKLLRFLRTYREVLLFLQNLDFYSKHRGPKVVLYYEDFYLKRSQLLEQMSAFFAMDRLYRQEEIERLEEEGLLVLGRKAMSGSDLKFYFEQKALGWRMLFTPKRYQPLLARYDTVGFF